MSLPPPPVPGWVTEILHGILNSPRAALVVGAILALLALAGFVAIAWWQRAELLAWFTTRSRRRLLAAGSVAFVLLAGFGWLGLRSWHYVEHDNAFCSSCHVMVPAWQKFQASKHAQLSCHQCHQQSILASARQVVLWIADRPERIPPHAKVPNERCVVCHVKGDSARWRQIAATEGHRLHLESPRLPRLECVRCHGFSVHQFVPNDLTCGQAGCHTAIRVRLGKMTTVTPLHCTVCHIFTRQVAVPRTVPDSLRRWLMPARRECLACHTMKRVLADQQLARDPHGAVCGACHNPHTQTSVPQAVRSCSNDGCHARADTLTGAHRGLHPTNLQNCTACHQPHSWKVHGQGKCTDCHADILRVSLTDGRSSAEAGPPGRQLGGGGKRVPVPADYSPPGRLVDRR